MDKALIDHVSKSMQKEWIKSHPATWPENQDWHELAKTAIYAVNSYKHSLPFCGVTQDELDAGDKIRDEIHATQNWGISRGGSEQAKEAQKEENFRLRAIVDDIETKTS